MPLRPPPAAPAPLTHLDEQSQLEVVKGLYDLYKQKQTVLAHCHHDVSFISHLAKDSGRWNVYRLLRGDAVLNDIRLEPHTSLVDRTTLKGMVWVDQLFKPRVPLARWLLPEIRCPVLLHITWARQPDGSLAITELYEHVSTMYLPGLLGPWGLWAHAHFIQPTGRFLVGQVFEASVFVRATINFLVKQFGGWLPASVQTVHPAAHAVAHAAAN